MRLKTQPGGTPLSDDERKQMAGMLVKMGYTVRQSREKMPGKSVYQHIIIAEEGKQ